MQTSSVRPKKLSPSQRATLLRLINSDVVAWGERNFTIEDRSDPNTGAELGPGLIILTDHQKRILRAALQRDQQGRYRWTTIVWSAPKKCLSPETRVVDEHLNWVPVGSLKIGDRLLAFDENPTRPINRKTKAIGGTGRRYRVATVLDTGLQPMMARRIHLADGTVLTASHDHRWLLKVRGGENLKWRKTQKLRAGDVLSRFLPTWDEPQDYDDGYMAGCLDGEGHIRPDGREISIGQKDNELLSECLRIFDDHGVEYGNYTQTNLSGPYAGRSIQKVAVRGGRPWNLYVLGHFRPKRLLAKMLPKLDGGIGQIWRMQDVEIVEIEETVAELVMLQTSTETYFAEGFAAHNSGKTRIGALVAAWLAQYAGAYAEIYCLANDGKQSADRVLAAIKKAIALGPALKEWKDLRTRINLPSGAFIEAVPVDPTGEAGANPTASIWSELWGFRLSAKERLWTEMTIPPTRMGKAIRWVESYAGYVGESPVLEQLYDQGVNQGKRHPAFPELPVYINERARLFCYWDHKPRMVWQTPEYYAAEAATLTETEFRRVHRNEWVTSIAQAIPIERWDACFDPSLPPLGPREPIVIGVDLSVSGDYTALTVVSAHPNRKGQEPAIRAVEVFEPPPGGRLDYSQTIEPALRRWCKGHNTVCVAYDEYQAHKMAMDLTKELGVWFEPFPQGKGNAQKPGRPVGDKMFYDLVMAGRLAHNGDPTLRQHVMNAAGKSIEEKSLRFVKKSERLKIDALVAASMAVATISRLNLS